MVNPAWFFSTLAQSAAAIVGFVIAFGAVLHQLESQRRRENTQEVREDLNDLKNEYSSVLGSMNGMFHELGNDPFGKDYINWVDEESPNMKEGLKEDEEIKYPHCTLAFVHLNRPLGLLNKVDASPNPKSNYLLSETEFNLLRDSVEYLRGAFGPTNQSEGLYKEMKSRFLPANVIFSLQKYLVRSKTPQKSRIGSKNRGG